MRLTGNKGEWSELYVLLRLLSYGKLFAANKNMNRDPNLFFPILKILREEKKGFRMEYQIADDAFIDIYCNGELLERVPAKRFKAEADYLLMAIQEGGNRAFEISRTSRFMEYIRCLQLAAPSTDKTDITLQIRDVQTGYSPICGFSIKSELGSAPTLLNASRATNYVYEIDGLSDSQIDMVNTIEGPTKIMERMQYIKQNASVFNGHAVNSIFANNLMLVDSRMEEIIAWVLFVHYFENINSCEAIVNWLEINNPIHFPSEGFYRYKFKKLLCSIALGMKPSSKWNGRDEANGGYIIVKDDGDVVAYHIYNRDLFEDYLLKNTKLERASTKRHEFASIYKENGKTLINLNLQIRFI